MLDFKSEEEAKQTLSFLRPNRKWRIWPYVPVNGENDLENNNKNMLSKMIENKLYEALTGKDLRGNKIDKTFEELWKEYMELLRQFEPNK